MGAGVVHGVTYGVAAASTAVLKGISNGLVHYATGVNPLSVDESEEELVPDEPLRPHAAQSAQSSSRSRGWWAFPAKEKQQPFKDPAAYNGTGQFAINIEDDAPAAAAAALMRPPSRPVAQRDLRHARATLDADPSLPRKRGGR